MERNVDNRDLGFEVLEESGGYPGHLYGDLDKNL